MPELELRMMDFWIILAGAISSISCALLGNFLVLRRMSMMGDAISHAVLPGIAAAFLLTESRGSLTMFLGAAAVGVLTAVFTQWVHQKGRVESGAAMGVVFTTLFAIGLILIRRGADHVDLDPSCVLYGAIESIPLDTWLIAGIDVPRAVVIGSVVMLIDLAFVVVLFKELRISSFDPGLSTTLGFNATFIQYMLMALVAVTTVASFETVGSIIVIAMLIVPAAAAHLLTDRLAVMVGLSTIIAALASVTGHLSAITLPRLIGYEDTSTSGMMAGAAGVIFLLAMVFAPRHGLASKAVHRIRFNLDVLKEDVLGLLYRLDEAGETVAAGEAPQMIREALGVSTISTRLAFMKLQREGKIASAGEAYALTEQGRSHARNLVRTHRLWESYLAKHMRWGSKRLHASAEQLEHLTTEAMHAQLAQETNNPQFDPQGKPVPPQDEQQS